MKRNPLSSFHPGLLTPRQQRARYGRVPYNRRVAALIRKYRGMPTPATERELSRMHRSARRSFKGKAKLAQLFHEVYGRNPNPREIPDLSPQAIKALRKLVRLKTRMQKKRRTKKRRNSRKGKMPAALKAYWAKKRAAKQNRRRRATKRRVVKANRRRRRIVTNPRVRAFRKRRASSRPRRRRFQVRRMPRTVRPPFPMTTGQLKKYARQLSRATGKRVVIKKP